MTSPRFHAGLAATAASVLLGCLLAMPGRSSAALPLITWETSSTSVLVKVGVERSKWRASLKSNWLHVVQLWSLGTVGWRRLASSNMASRRTRLSRSISQVCRHANGPTVVSIRVGLKKEGSGWWNPRRGAWSSIFAPIARKDFTIQCVPPARTPSSLYPGATTPPTPARPVPPAQDGTPSPDPPVVPAPDPATPAPPAAVPPVPPAADPPVPPAADPSVPAVPPRRPLVNFVPRRVFFRFRRALAGETFDSRRLTRLKSWVSRLGIHRLRARQAARLAKAFSFDSNRLKAAIALCPAIVDKLNLSLVTDTFTFGSNKTRFLRRCK